MNCYFLRQATVNVPPENVLEMLKVYASEGNIAAIKFIRQAADMSLKEAKDFVDSWAVMFANYDNRVRGRTSLGELLRAKLDRGV